MPLEVLHECFAPRHYGILSRIQSRNRFLCSSRYVPMRMPQRDKNAAMLPGVALLILCRNSIISTISYQLSASIVFIGTL